MARYISKKLTIPIVHTYHTVYEDYTHYFSPYRKWGKAMVAVFSRKVLKNVNVVITPTKKVQHLLEVYGIKQPIYVVPTGIDVVKFINPLSELIKKKIKLRHGINANDKVLICVGRVAKEKKLRN
ncbi:glycosyltransferase [Sutcliffiella cohnii]